MIIPISAIRLHEMQGSKKRRYRILCSIHSLQKFIESQCSWVIFIEMSKAFIHRDDRESRILARPRVIRIGHAPSPFPFALKGGTVPTENPVSGNVNKILKGSLMSG